MSLKPRYSSFEMFVAMTQLCGEEGEKQVYPPINQQEIAELKKYVRTKLKAAAFRWKALRCLLFWKSFRSCVRTP